MVTRFHRLLSGWFAFPALTIAYVVAGKLGLQFAFLNASATPLWPPTGIALAALLLGGYRLWPAIFLGAFLVNVTTAGSLATSFGIATGNTLEAVIGVFLVRRFANGRRAFALPRTIFAFGVGAGFAATAVSATIGVSSLALGGYAPWPNLGPIWLTWWLGDAAGALVIAPFVIVWANERGFTESRRWAEALGVGLVMLAVATVVFSGAFQTGIRDAPLAFLCLPPLVWAAYRFGARGAASALLMLSVIAAMATVRGVGPFAIGRPNESLLLLQAFLVTMSGTVLPLAALAEDLARRAASSAENARLYRQSEGQRRTAEAFAETGRALVQSLEMGEVADRIVASVRELLGGTTAIVFQRDPATGHHTALATSGDGASAFIGLTIPAGAGAIGLAVRDRRPIVTPDVTADPRILLTPEIRKRIDQTPMRAVVAVPLVTQGRAIGAFLVGDRAGRIFTAEETVVAEAFAHHAALAIGNARLYDEAQQARRAAEAASRRSAFLADASAIIGSTLDDEAVLSRVAELAVPRTADWCAVFMEEHGGPIRCVTFHHHEPAKTERGRRYITAQPIDLDAPRGVGKVIRTGTSDLEPDVSDEMIRAVARDEAGVRIRLEIGHRSIMAVPLRIDESLRGAMVFGRGVRNAYDATDVALAEDLGRRVALAMQNARLYRAAREARERTEKARWQAAFLAETSRLLASSLDYDATLDTLIRHAVPTLADWAVVHIARRDGSVRRIGPAYADPALAPLAEEVALRLDPQSTITVPLVARGRTLGSLTFVSLESDRRYGDNDLAFAEEIGRRAGVAIDNARLYRQAEGARAEAEAANRAKDEFLAVLSHELRTPLNSIAGWIQMLEAGTVEGVQAERAMASVGRNVIVLRRLIEDLLDVSRIVTGKLTLERSPCELGAIVEQTIESFGREAETKAVAIEADLERSIVVEADTLRLRQVISNLLSNALKFTPSGGDVSVTLRRERDHATVTVADTGGGIPLDVLPHIFERFRQADSSSTRRHGGLGLGLAIVKHLVELHDGTVRAANREAGHGAIFTVELPIVS